jgi:hypothetical protein
MSFTEWYLCYSSVENKLTLQSQAEKANFKVQQTWSAAQKRSLSMQQTTLLCIEEATCIADCYIHKVDARRCTPHLARIVEEGRVEASSNSIVPSEAKGNVGYSA